MTGERQLGNLYYAVTTAITSVVTIYLLDTFQKELINKSFAGFLTVLFASVLIVFSNAIVEYIFVKSKTIGKIFDSANYIEGFWYDVSRNERGDVEHLVILKIERRDNKFHVYGDTFNCNFAHISTYNSVNVMYEKPTLMMEYNSSPSNGSKDFEYGIDIYKFSNPINSYSVSCFDLSKSKHFIATGFRITKKGLKKYNQFREIRDKVQFLKDKKVDGTI